MLVSAYTLTTLLYLSVRRFNSLTYVFGSSAVLPSTVSLRLTPRLSLTGLPPLLSALMFDFKEPALAISFAEIAATLPSADAAAEYILLSSAPELDFNAPSICFALSIVDLVSPSASSSTASIPNDKIVDSRPKRAVIDSSEMLANCALVLSKPPVNKRDSIVAISDSRVSVASST